MLDDQPHHYGDDPLGFGRIANDLASLILASGGSTPLALGIESGWGMGKSTMMRHLERALAEDARVETVWFNAWTADEGSALEGLVKSVLDKLDRNVLRRTARNERLLSWARALGLVVADWLKLGSLVNTLWREVSDDPRARNEMSQLIRHSVRDWANVRVELGPERLLVVFVDDLDRCSPINVLQIFEAIKLYLDAPGLVFVVGYDPDVVTDAILEVKQYGERLTSHRYLEKIVQLVYRLPSVSDDGAERLLDFYLRSSGTSDLFDRAPRSLTIEQNDRNPRRIKRFLNAFILEYGLDAEWENLGPETLVRVLIIDVYFPDFARLLRSRSHRDPVRDFREYVAVREIVRQRSDRPEDLQVIDAAFAARGLAAPPKGAASILPDIEREIPPSFPQLAQNSSFIALLDGLDDVERLREKLRRFSATTLRGALREGPIFITWRREDQVYASRVYDALLQRLGPKRVVFDLASLEAGTNWVEATQAAIHGAGMFLAIIGPEWTHSRLGNPDDFVRIELSAALASDTPLLPVLVGGAAMPVAAELPKEIRRLAQINAIAISDDRWENDIERLIDAIERLSVTAPATRVSPFESPELQPRPGRARSS